MTAIYETMTHDTESHPRADPRRRGYRRLRRGAAQGFAHILYCLYARRPGAASAPASAFLAMRGDGDAEESGHALGVTHYLLVIGWIGFDCCNSICVDENYVRVAIGFDHLSAAPTKRRAHCKSGLAKRRSKSALKIGQAQEPATELTKLRRRRAPSPIRHQGEAERRHASCRVSLTASQLGDSRVRSSLSKPHGFDKGLTNYGDRDFARFLRRSFARSMKASPRELCSNKPVVPASLMTPSGFNNCHRLMPDLVEAVSRGVLAAGARRVPFRLSRSAKCS